MEAESFIEEYGLVFEKFRPIVESQGEIRRNWKDSKGVAMNRNIENMRKKYADFAEETFNVFHILEQADIAGKKLNSFGYGMHGGSAFSINQLLNAVDVKIKSLIGTERMP